MIDEQLSVVPADNAESHRQLAEQMGLGTHEFVLPLVYSLLAGLSTGIGGLFVFTLRNASPKIEMGVSLAQRLCFYLWKCRQLTHGVRRGERF